MKNMKNGNDGGAGRSVPCCDGCSFMKVYDYGKKIYYCDHEGRMDDMGKLGVGHLPEASPEWCPVNN